MSLRDRLGLYGPNKPQWTDGVYQDIDRAKVKWVVWRTNTDPDAPQILANAGYNVIAQAPDRFSNDEWLDPAYQAGQDYNIVAATCRPGTPYVPDNEPNLNPLRAGAWYAEQWTRYLRAYMAVWRWLDAAGHYPLVTPALAVGPDRNGSLWHHTGSENEREADSRGLHAYWQVHEQIADPNFGAPWKLIPNTITDSDLYVLEYANTLPELTHAQTLPEYETFLRSLPPNVHCACLFGLDLTHDWDRFRITEPVLDWLAELQ